MYGNIGIDDPPVIDAQLAKLPRGAIVVNLGCGPNADGSLHNLARALSRFQFHSTLVLADLIVEPIRNAVWVPGPAETRVVELNAATATKQLGGATADVVLAFGLFGALSSSTTTTKSGKNAWPVVLMECFKVLKEPGRLIVANSVERQPFGEFGKALNASGFEVEHSQESDAMYRSTACGGRRYLVVCRKTVLHRGPNADQ